MSDILSGLEQQLAALKATVAPPVNILPMPAPTIPAPPTSVTVSLDELRQLVKEMIGESSVSQIEVPKVKEYTMLEAVNLALTGEEQSWLCSDEVIKGVANFMATDKGRKFTKQFITEYREYYES